MSAIYALIRITVAPLVLLFFFLSPVMAINTTCTSPQKTTTINGVQSTNYDQRASVTNGTLIDATSASWKIDNAYPVQVGNGSDICMRGGNIEGLYADSTPWTVLHSTAALYMEGPNFSVENLRVKNYGDAVRIRDNGNNFTFRHVYFSHMRDDCIENDKLNGGIVENSLFDGCYNAFSARPDSTGTDGRGKTWTIRNSLVRLEAMQEGYNGAKWVTGGFFKWDKASPSLSPDLDLQNNIFRADQNADTVGLAVPLDKLKTCINNTMVWLGPGNYPEQLPATLNGQTCFTVTKDKSVWDNAVAQWLNGNPTTTPTTTITPTISSTPGASCQNKSKGDADCQSDGNGKTITIADFEIWRKEYLGSCSQSAQNSTSCQTDSDNNGILMDADFDNDSMVAISDFQIWRQYFFSGI